MTKGARKTAAMPMPQVDVGEQLERMAAFNGAALDMLTRMGQAYFNSVTALNEEMMKFMALRMQHDAEFGQSIAKCDDWAAAADLQQSWVREAGEEYFAEAGKLLELASKVTMESWKPVQERATKALNELQTTAP
jgi:phasin family protein